MFPETIEEGTVRRRISVIESKTEKEKGKRGEKGWIHGVEHGTEGNISEACNERTKHIGSAH